MRALLDQLPSEATLRQISQIDEVSRKLLAPTLVALGYSPDDQPVDPAELEAKYPVRCWEQYCVLKIIVMVILNAEQLSIENFCYCAIIITR